MHNQRLFQQKPKGQKVLFIFKNVLFELSLSERTGVSKIGARFAFVAS